MSYTLLLLEQCDNLVVLVRNNLWDWQSLQPDSGPGQQFFNFCDALEVKNGAVAPAGGWGLDHALTAWGNYWTSTYYSIREHYFPWDLIYATDAAFLVVCGDLDAV